MAGRSSLGSLPIERMIAVSEPFLPSNATRTYSTAYLILLELVYALVYTKTPPLKGELEQAHAIAARLGVFAADLRNIRAKYRGQRPPPECAGAGDQGGTRGRGEGGEEEALAGELHGGPSGTKG